MRPILEVDLHEGGDGGLLIGSEGASVAKAAAFVEPPCLDI